MEPGLFCNFFATKNVFFSIGLIMIKTIFQGGVVFDCLALLSALSYRSLLCILQNQSWLHQL